jgi:hypothetical protein
MASSTIPALKSNLETRLKARPALSGVYVSYGPPFPVPEPELIALWDVRDWTQRPAALGKRGRDEEYELAILIRVVQSTVAEHKPVTERAFALLAEIENELRNDPTVGVAEMIAAELGGQGAMSLQEDANDEQRVSTLLVNVHCHARI